MVERERENKEEGIKERSLVSPKVLKMNSLAVVFLGWKSISSFLLPTESMFQSDDDQFPSLFE